MRTEAQDLDALRRGSEQWHDIFDDFHVEVVELVTSMIWSWPRADFTAAAGRAARR